MKLRGKLWHGCSFEINVISWTCSVIWRRDSSGLWLGYWLNYSGTAVRFPGGARDVSVPWKDPDGHKGPDSFLFSYYQWVFLRGKLNEIWSRSFNSYSYNKTNETALISQIYFWNRTLHVSDSFSVHHQESSTVHTAIGICHTGYTEFYSKNKFEKLVHLVGFIIRIYHDARLSEYQILSLKSI